jgi:hypothetical protein
MEKKSDSDFDPGLQIVKESGICHRDTIFPLVEKPTGFIIILQKPTFRRRWIFSKGTP